MSTGTQAVAPGLPQFYQPIEQSTTHAVSPRTVRQVNTSIGRIPEIPGNSLKTLNQRFLVGKVAVVALIFALAVAGVFYGVLVLRSSTTTTTVETTTTTTTATTTTTTTTSTTSTTTDTTTSTTSTTTTTTRTTTTTSVTTATSTTSTSTTSTTSTSTTSTTSTSTTSTTTQTTITFAPVGIYALNIPTCATWNDTGLTMAGNSNGTLGSDLGSLSAPVSIFVDNNNNLFVADRDNARVLKFVPNATIGIIVAGNGTIGNGSNQLSSPKGVAIDQYGDIIVADSSNYRIQKFVNGSTIGITLAENSTINPLGQMRDLHIDVNNNIYVTDSDNNQVGKFIPFSSIGVVVAGGGPAGPGLNQLSSPFGNFIDPNGTLYIADQLNFRVMKYDPGSLNGTIVAGNGTTGSTAYLLAQPIAVIVDNNGYIYVADYSNGRIMKWTTNYAAGGVCIIGCTGTTGVAATQLRGPRDLKFDRYGNIYITDQANHRIQKFMIQIPPLGCSSESSTLNHSSLVHVFF
ncbi:unnamed protein product [Rotaria socialis]|uniref:Uncharacterized protein n=1 Tax=Rotaria socialis TaxID=392032 RepID=A0A818EF80_9BILA|nr:unnamed protein product [Rotaria socialis]